MTEMVRTHVLFPKEVLQQFDELVGPRKRSEKIVELIERYLRQQRAIEVTKRYGGAMTPEDHPEWATREEIDRWVREERQASDRTLRADLSGDLSA